MGNRTDSWLHTALPEVTLSCTMGRLQLSTHQLGACKQPRECPRTCGWFSQRSAEQATAVREERRRQSQEDAFSFGFLVSNWMPARYKWLWHGFYHLRSSLKWRWSFPVCRIRRKATLMTLIGHGTYVLYWHVCRWLLLLGLLWQPGSAARKEGDDVTASYGSGHMTCPGPGNINLI